MSEKITVHNLKNPEIALSMDRDAFYKEQVEVFKKTGKPSKACQVADVFLFTEDKEIILQKRSSKKTHNANLLDKSIGGHVTFGDTAFYTVIVETVQELKTPSIVLSTEEDFQKTYLSTLAIIKQIDEKILFIPKLINKEKIIIANNVHLFFGIYSGAIKPVDKEASGVLYYNLETLREEMKSNPDFFTDDLKFFLHNYEKEINEFLKCF